MLKVTKIKGFTLSLEDRFLEKPDCLNLFRVNEFDESS